MFKNIAILTLLCSWAITIAQEPIRYTTKQGLPSNHIYDIAEDANGFMWFATNRGLVKYDGDTFKTLTIKDGLPNNDTWLLETDLQGRLWYFSKSKYQGYIKNDSIYKISSKNKESLTPRFMYKTKDSLWIYSSSGLYQATNHSLIKSDLYGFNDLLIKNKHKEIYPNTSGYLPTIVNPATKEYIAISQSKLFVFNKDYQLKKEIEVNIPVEYKNPKIQNSGLMYNNIGFFALSKGVLFLDFNTYKPTYVSFKELVNIEETNYFRLRSLKEEFQISIPGHLLIFDYNLKLKNSYRFPTHLSRSSFKDNNDNFWLSDLKAGITLYPSNQYSTEYYLQNKKIQKIGTIDGELLAGENDNGFYKFNKKANLFRQIVTNIGRSNGEIYSIRNSPNFLISGQKTVSINEGKLQEFHPHSSGLVGTSFEEYKHFKDIEKHNNKLYGVNANGFLAIINDTIRYLKRYSGLLCLKSFNNKLYIGSSDGLKVLYRDTIIKPKIKSTILDVSVTTITQYQENIIVGTDGRGMYLYNEDRLTHLKNTDGYNIQRVLNKDDTIWLATNSGVHQLTLNQTDLENSKITNSFYEADGLLANNCNDAFIEDDTLYVASDIGIAKLNVNNPRYTRAPNIYFNTKNDTLTFANEARTNIAYSFGLLDYANKNHTTYQYRLLPSQEKWVNTQTKTINFSNLSPIVHTLEIKATDQHLNETIVKQYIKIQPYWYETTLAIVGFIFIFVSFLGYLFFLLKKRLEYKIRQKAKLDKKIAGLELQALRSQMNPHFVHNSLNAIQYFIQRKEVELSENYLSKFSKLIRLFFEYSRRQTVSVNEEIDLLNKYLEIEKLRFEEKLTYSIKISDGFDADELEIPSMLLQPIVENAVNHGIFHKKGQGHINIEFAELDKNYFKVIVKDDGIGIHKAKAMFKSSSKNYQSNSSHVLKERIDILNKRMIWKIEYSIKDISEIDNTNTGTIAQLIFYKPPVL